MDVEYSVVAAGNTCNPCLLVLKDKGYRLWIKKAKDGDTLWFAEKNGVALLAYSSQELLGLAALSEHFGRDWNRQDPNVLDALYDTLEADSDEVASKT